jgi:hypothetical protein
MRLTKDKQFKEGKSTTLLTRQLHDREASLKLI